jgi:hypothetical protein
MESNQPLDDNFGTGLNISANILEFLKETAKWAYFLSILGFIMVGFIVFAGIFAGTIFSVFLGEFQNEIPGFSPVIITIFYLIIAGIYIFPILYLFRFAKNTKLALQSDDQIALNAAFENLKSHYKFIGIFAAIMLGFYALIIVFSLLFGVML